MLEDMRASADAARKLYEQQAKQFNDFRADLRREGESDYARVCRQRDELARCLREVMMAWCADQHIISLGGKWIDDPREDRRYREAQAALAAAKE